MSKGISSNICTKIPDKGNKRLGLHLIIKSMEGYPGKNWRRMSRRS